MEKKKSSNSYAQIAFGIITAVLIVGFLYVIIGNSAKTNNTENPFSLDKVYIKLSTPANLLKFMGEEAAQKITSSGATEGNASKVGAYSMESQRIGVYAVEGGIASNDPALIDKGLSAYEWGFDQMASDGSFPLERADSEKEMKYENIHPISFFVESAAHSVTLIRAASVDQSLKSRAEALVPKLLLAGRYMDHQANLEDFYTNDIDTNMLTTPATAFQEIASLTRDTELESKAKWMVGQVLARQYSDGTLPEKKKCNTPDQACYGFDTTYQSVSLEYLARYAGLVNDPVWKATVVAAVQRGTEKLLTKVNITSGKIDTSANSRTVACGPRVTTPGPKGRDIDIIPLRFYYLGLLLNKVQIYAPIADKIQEYGQGFDHTEQCTEAADVSS
jgi:hypothetical protein